MILLSFGLAIGAGITAAENWLLGTLLLLMSFGCALWHIRVQARLDQEEGLDEEDIDDYQDIYPRMW